MAWFNFKKNDDLVKKLQESRSDFSFGWKTVREKLLQSIEDQQMSLAEQKIRELTRKSFLRRHAFASAAMVLLLIVVGSSAALTQANVSKPGDKLHSIEEFQERFILSLPLPESQKLRLQASQVEERNQELDSLLHEESSEIKTTTVRKSQEHLSQAIESTRHAQEHLLSKGKTSQAEKIEETLIRLEHMAEVQEAKVEELKKNEKNDEVRKKLDHELEAIKKARNRARHEEK